MNFRDYSDRHWLILILLGFLGVVLLIHGGMIFWNLRNSNNLFTINSVIDSLGCVSEFIVGFVFVLLAVYQDSVLEALDDFLSWLGFAS
jgi:hypothetical protein